MKNRNYSNARVLTMIPIIVLVITVICMVLATILEVPTNRGAIYSILAFIGLLNMLIAPFPCLVISIIGTVYSAKATKEGIAQAKKYLILGIIEILVYVIGGALTVLMILGGQSV
ncbi:hypothetical protein [Butyrivibrio sp. LC3010]|uniref:hypothetical protein n=1 Tax=Butyrivibrio sp. LC3010 TaxID=1280680 RepID=UPI00040AA15B|nr:hypothetical protein [Butyrivibrio sp. LC3010]